MEGFIGTAVIAIASGLAWIAYRHHDGFLRIYFYLAIGLLVSMVAVLAYDAGAETVYQKVEPFVVPMKGVQALEASRTGRPNLPLTFLIFAAILAYLSILYHLPRILNLPEQSDPDQKDDKRD